MFIKSNINSPRDWNQIGVKLGTEHVIYQKLENIMENKDILLTGLKVLSLVSKCVYYKPKRNV